jgi:hypothetical protein
LGSLKLLPFLELGMPAETCFQHPGRPAVEHCEICRRPVCGLCLWYAESGERLCSAHAAEFEKEGKVVHPPERYVEGIAPSEASVVRPPAQDVPYRGNSTDVGALVAAVAGIVALASCAGLAWVIPLIALALGLVSWLQSKDAINARRTRWLAVIGMASGGVFGLVMVALFLLVFLFFAFTMTIAVRGGGGFPTPFPLPTLTP